ncbi:hypothetical protein [Nitrospirillum bahiense]|uniref:Uncharacterized protein n=1 Tax=Nitrospirillum amazonense TaxID=28077 RepID=A0A560F1T0_9PROT|nr:hypothetical protein [Nitrospirillum amazonense]TWB15576.1 hypothetical protein FBZ88_12929 [Nitrospirillum amazonense]
MTDALAIIAAACDYMRETGFSHTPRIVNEADFDLSNFDRQDSSVAGASVEYVDQRGPGMAGDDFHGTVVWPIGDGKLFVLEFNT